MTTGIVSTVVLAIGVYFIVTFFLSRGGGNIAITPTPTPTGTYVAPPQITSELESIFKNVSSIDFKFPQNKEDAPSSLKSFISNQTMVEKEFKRLRFIAQSGQTLTFTDALNGLSVNYPTELNSYIEDSHMAFIYGQEELPESQEKSKRIVFIVEINNPSKVSEIMRKWELTITNDLRILFDIDPAKQATQNFIDNNRENIKIRYKNFPLPDKSIDYAITPSLTGKTYLIITNSRESIFTPIDRIRGL